MGPKKGTIILVRVEKLLRLSIYIDINLHSFLSLRSFATIAYLAVKYVKVNTGPYFVDLKTLILQIMFQYQPYSDSEEDFKGGYLNWTFHINLVFLVPIKVSYDWPIDFRE